jgi:hypothetical protein
LPRIKAGWGERQPSSRCGKMICGSKSKSQAGFGEADIRRTFQFLRKL